MAINKVEANGETLIDLTNDTAEAEDVLEGQTFHLRSGAVATGTYRPSAEIEARLEATVGHSSKNLLKIEADSQTINGVTFTVDKTAGTITANGTATQDARYSAIRFYLPAGNYYFLGCPNGGSASTWDVYMLDYVTGERCKMWNGITDSSSDYDGTKKECKIVAEHLCGITLRIRRGQTVNNLVFKPMVWDGSIADDTFEPYVTPTDEKKQDKPVVLWEAASTSELVSQVTFQTADIDYINYFIVYAQPKDTAGEVTTYTVNNGALLGQLNRYVTPYSYLLYGIENGETIFAIESDNYDPKIIKIIGIPK